VNSLNPYTQEAIKSWQELVQEGGNNHVSVDEHRIAELADQHYDDNFITPNWRIPGIYPDNDKTMAALTVVSSVFNSDYLLDTPGSAWQLENIDDPSQPYKEAMALHRSLYVAFGGGEDITAEDLAPYLRDHESIQRLFPGIPDTHLRLQVGNDFVAGLRNRYDGSIQNLLEEATVTDPETAMPQLRAFNTGKGIVELLIDESVFGSAFSDCQSAGGKQFPFNKRAQLAALVYYGRALNPDTIPKLGDIGAIGPVVDYRIPQAKRKLGVLAYGPELAEMVDNWQKLEPDGEMEIQIRGATNFACILMMNAINSRRTEKGLPLINISHYDFWQWQMGCSLEDGSYPHRVSTAKY
jgi:hypothetical protein